jgi:hypothetical protein
MEMREERKLSLKDRLSKFQEVESQVFTFLNFLKFPASVISNIQIVDSEAKFQIPEGSYSSILLIATDNNNATFHMLPLHSSPL